ncbi:heavy metal translocating P-type ATPase [Thermosipho africanus Ob7]|jgi:Cu+-exporting ATPase|uniref:Copper-translocating P-type ATPase n=1 Tax=Thermosipho africanus (strain TCF52B) TaxID=484019 RepID=B7IFJ9_THEAB|nr:heavy metal translocating P-type ATPase [Thermosipho africanus]ACJ74863.1 copper-translocating P-type ATPase [Thermosipho africanus TCF52B]MDK2839509.1 P-type Cu+ transporter [Thermosipho sp. (in: thermotogales)]RDI92627.1 heavy metal translocating P-type ATPase [Thermosipho africanus Ob7]
MPEKKITFSVTGMTCANCARTVEKVLSKDENIKFASVNLATNTAFVVGDESIDLEKVKKLVESVGYGVSTEKPQQIEEKRFRQIKRSLIMALAVTIPISILMIINMFFVKVPYFVLLEVIGGAFVTFVAGKNTIKGAWIALTHKHTNMDTLIFFGALTSWLTSVLALFGFELASFGAIGTMIISFHLLGRFIESYLRDRATKEIKKLLSLQAREARVVINGEELFLPIEAVKENMLVIVKPGERIPVDGIVIEGASGVDESVVTGESMPVEKKENDEVVGGALNLTGILKIKVTKTGEDTFLSKMIQLIQEAQGAKVPIQALADRITNWFVPTIITLAVISGIFWYFGFDKFYPLLESARKIFPWILSTNDPLSFAIFAFVATVVIACPCALGLATPMALITGTSLAAKKGLLIRNAEAIQTMKDVKVVLMDKTGTITQGNPAVVDTNLDEEVKKIVASIEKNSNHPLAKAISKISEKYLEIKDIKEISGKGVIAKYDGKEYFVGKPEDYSRYETLLKEGYTVVEVRQDSEIVGYIAIEDPIRQDSKIAIENLKSLNVIPVMVTGDNEKTAKIVAEKVGIEKVHSQVKPDEKLEIVRKYQVEGNKVLMVGDGMNDAAALKGADVGIAIGSGTDLAIDNADIIITKEGISKIVDAIYISNLTFKVIKQNLFWAFFYNIIAIPMAMLGLLHPAIAEAAMAFSSITVILNSSKINERRYAKVFSSKKSCCI